MPKPKPFTGPVTYCRIIEFSAYQSQMIFYERERAEKAIELLRTVPHTINCSRALSIHRASGAVAACDCHVSKIDAFIKESEQP